MIVGATGHCGGTPHSCGSGPAQFNVLPDKSGVPVETMRLDFLQYQGAPDDRLPLPHRLLKVPCERTVAG
jgi:hypothetical protein